MKKLSEQRLGWLGGIMDGEGSFMVVKKANQNRDIKYKPFYLYSTISVANTDLNIIQEVENILKELKIHYLVYKTNKRGNYPQATIMIRERNAQLEFLSYIIPYLVGKKVHAKYLKKFIQIELEIQSKIKKQRIVKRDKLGRIIERNKSRKYMEKELSLYQKIKSLKVENKIKM